mgnify:CR=1 FL=1
MKRLLTLALLLTIHNFILAQNKSQAEKVLKQIENTQAIDSLKKVYPRWDIMTETLSVSDTLNFPFLKHAVVGDLVKISLENRNNQQYMIKILDQEVQRLCRVQYIFLDGETYSIEEIDSIRTDIHRRVQRGEKFHELVDEYNMDENSGDIGWFSKEMVVSAFFDPIAAQTKDEVFDISIPKNKWYYVVKKTEHDLIRTFFHTLWIGIN